MSRIPGNRLDLGIVDGQGAPLVMIPKMRSTHLYVCGATGTGKSKMLESLIRQDIKNWYKTKCGALIIDPHGSLYNGLVDWIAWNEKYLSRGFHRERDALTSAAIASHAAKHRSG